MNRVLTSLFGLSFAGLVVLFAAQGVEVIAALSALWTFLHRVAAEAPAGVGAFALALGVAMAVQPYLRKWLPDLHCPLSREFLIESGALLAGLGLMWVQWPTWPGAGLGLLAGWLAPYLYKGLVASGRLLARLARRPRP